MQFKAVLFDLDGTLLDTVEDLADAMNASLHHYGFPVHPVDKYRYFVGEGMERLTWKTLPETCRSDENVRQCLAKMKEIYGEHWGDKTHPYKGIEDLLAGLESRGLPMVVLSNKPDDFTQVIMAKYFPGYKFKAIFGARPGVPRKPDPTAALDIARDMGIAPGDFAYLGDTNTDMVTAVAAGMYPVGALWGFRDEPELVQSGARIVLAHPVELLKYIDA